MCPAIYLVLKVLVQELHHSSIVGEPVTQLGRAVPLIREDQEICDTAIGQHGLGNLMPRLKYVG